MTDSIDREQLDQERLERWLDAARRADAEIETSATSAAPDGVTDLVERQRRAKHLHELAHLIRQAPRARLGIRHRRLAFGGGLAVAAAVLLALGVGLGTHSAADGPSALAPTNAQQPVIETPVVAQAATEAPAIDAQRSANLRQVVGKVIATRASGENGVVGADTPLATGDELSTTAEAFASLEAGKARVDLSAATTLQLSRIEPGEQLFHLRAGRVDISVPRIPGEQRLVQVTTADARVTVHGTVFSVEVHQDDLGPVTTVGVTRGLVAVERGVGGEYSGPAVMLHPGETWTSRTGATSTPNEARVISSRPIRGAARASLAAKSATPTPDPKPSVGRPNPAEQTPPAPVPADTLVGGLAEQNRIFESAMRARDRGDDRAAITQLRELISTYPDSPLRSTAQAELGRARERLGANP